MKSNCCGSNVFSTGGPAFIAAACDAAKKVVLIDHHKTAAEDLESQILKGRTNLETYVDMHR
jgi:oligoribonuclease NrnB/cAMP/cGMP phosphodiesterase (DHH superfamily)